jgi:hypothetical protein
MKTCKKQASMQLFVDGAHEPPERQDATVIGNWTSVRNRLYNRTAKQDSSYSTCPVYMIVAFQGLHGSKTE